MWGYPQNCRVIALRGIAPSASHALSERYSRRKGAGLCLVIYADASIPMKRQDRILLALCLLEEGENGENSTSKEQEF